MAELASIDRGDPQEALARSRAAAERAAHLAREGYRHAAEAERSAAESHTAVAESLEILADRDPVHGPELRAKARRHRRSADEHLANAEIDERRLAEISGEEP